MRRLAFISTAVFIAMLCLSMPALAQQQVSSIHIKTSIPGVRFRVDGMTYEGQATFLWPKGSKHILEALVGDDGFQYNGTRTSRFGFVSLTDNRNLVIPTASRVHTITADPEISGYTMDFGAEHLVQLITMDGAPIPPPYPAPLGQGPTLSPATCEGGPGNPNGPSPDINPEFRAGVVYFGSECYWNNTSFWRPQGVYVLNAYPYPGFVFLGWKADRNPPDAYLRTTTFAIQGPLTIHVRFSPAKRVKFRTDPPGLNVMVDRAMIPTPDEEPCIPNGYLPPGAPRGILPLCIGDFDFAFNSTHVAGAPSPQVDRNGRTWVFESFTNGQGNHYAYVTGPTVYPTDTVTAKFTRGISATFSTQPSGLKIKINDRDNWGSQSFVYAAGTTQKLEAPLEQTDARGRKYVFRKWSDNGDATHNVTVPNDVTTFHVIAEYDLLSQLIVNTTPLGAEIAVDGVPCAIPCKIDRVNGTEVRLGAPQTAQLSGSHRLDFISWSDGGEREHTVRVTGSEPVTMNANYRTSYLLTTALDPPEGATLRLDPASPDGYFPADTVITVTADTGPGFRFRRWEGDLAGTGNIATLSMTRPRTIIGRFDRVPFISPAGIRNAAGQTPEGIVAPGSLISVFGANLAMHYEVGPSNPLSQSIAGTTLVVGNRILPLMFVSPDQINAQLPRDLAPGEHTLRVLRVGQTTIEGNFVVAPNAPGLFNQSIDGQAFGFARHEDGSAVSSASPARRGEQITVLGTGFGAYSTTLPEGFALPELPAFEIPQTVEIQAGDRQFISDWAGGAPGMVGIDFVRFRIPDELAPGAGIPFKIRVNGHESNTVLIPVE